MTLDNLLQLLNHPFVLVMGGGVLALVLALWAGAAVKGLGLDELRVPGLPQWRWSRFTRAVLFLAIFLPLAGGAWGLLADAAVALAGLVVRLASAVACVGVSLWVQRAREEGVQDQDRAERQRIEKQRELVLAIGGGAALVALVGAGGAVVIVGLALVALIAVLIAGGEPGRRLSLLLADLAAGVELRSRLRAGDSVEIDGVRHDLPLSPGLVQTRVEGAAGAERVRNVELLERLAERIEGV